MLFGNGLCLLVSCAVEQIFYGSLTFQLQFPSLSVFYLGCSCYQQRRIPGNLHGKGNEVTFKKYSLMGILRSLPGRSALSPAALPPWQTVTLSSPWPVPPYRVLLDKRNSPDLEQLMEQRKPYRYASGGDPTGCAMLLSEERDELLPENNQKLTQTIVSCLGQQM